MLCFGVALLGARITAEQLGGLGAESIAMVAGGVVATILFGALVGRLLGRPGTEGGLTGGAVACIWAPRPMMSKTGGAFREPNDS